MLVKYGWDELGSDNLSSGGNRTLMRLPAGAGLSSRSRKLRPVRVETSGLPKVTAKLAAGTLAYLVGAKVLLTLDSTTYITPLLTSGLRVYMLIVFTPQRDPAFLTSSMVNTTGLPGAIGAENAAVTTTVSASAVLETEQPAPADVGWTPPEADGGTMAHLLSRR